MIKACKYADRTACKHNMICVFDMYKNISNAICEHLGQYSETYRVSMLALVVYN